MEQLVIRYALPGLPVALVFYLYEGLTSSGSAILDITVVIIVAILLGNVIQQIWMLIFEWPRFGLGYNSEKRRVLKKLSRTIKGGDQLDPNELYARWESFLYSKTVEPSIRDKDRAIWHFHHANAANALGLFIGAFVSLRLSDYLLDRKLLFISIGLAFLAVGLLFIQKAVQTRHLVEVLEVFWVGEWYEKFLVEQGHKAQQLTDGTVTIRKDTS